MRLGNGARPMVEAPHDWLHAEPGTMSKHNLVARAIDYRVRKERWTAFTRFLDDGRICRTDKAAERALRGVASAASPGFSPAPSVAATALPSCIP